MNQSRRAVYARRLFSFGRAIETASIAGALTFAEKSTEPIFRQKPTIGKGLPAVLVYLVGTGGLNESSRTIGKLSTNSKTNHA